MAGNYVIYDIYIQYVYIYSHTFRYTYIYNYSNHSFSISLLSTFNEPRTMLDAGETITSENR